MNSPSEKQGAPAEADGGGRRSFLTKALAVVVGAIVGLVPLASGLATFLSPFGRKSKAKLVRIAPLGAVPDDGMPHRFAVITDREDAWNYYPPEPIGAVYLIRQPGEATPVAFTARCPHAGCFINFTPGATEFKCPCHTSKFHLDGTRVGGKHSVSPRGMDSLNVEVQGGEVLVEFQRFLTGRHEKKSIG